MRKYKGPLGVCRIAILASLLLTGCLKDKVIEKYTVYNPVFTLRTTVLASINGNPAQPVAQAGQLYVQGSYIYLNDVGKGIHIIDNSNPAHPAQTAFLNIPGNGNIAIRNNILYADMYADLLAIDITDPHKAKVTGSLSGFFYGRSGSPNPAYVITGWTAKDTSFPTTAPDSRQLINIPSGVFYVSNVAAVPAAAQSLTGTAGSTAAMTLVGDYLYAIAEEHALGVVHVADSTNPTQVTLLSDNRDLETIFPIQNHLLLGSKEGVYIYSIDNPAQPIELTEFTHGTSCDPVIADANYAYVTLHAGTSCGGAANELDVLSAQDLTRASLMRTYPMTSPSGLCKDGTLLFVCDGPAVKVFDATDPANLRQLTVLKVSDASDVIAAHHLLLVVSSGGLSQFDYTDPAHIVPLSYLPVK